MSNTPTLLSSHPSPLISSLLILSPLFSLLSLLYSALYYSTSSKST